MSDDRSWTLLRRLVRRERIALAVSTICALVWLGCGIGVPVVLGWTVQRGIVESELSAVWLGASLLVALGAGEAVFDALRHRFETAAFERARAQIRADVAAAALDLDEPTRDRWPAGQITARATSDADDVAGALEAWGYTVAYLLSIPVVVVLLLRLDVVIAVVVVVAVVLNVGVTWRVSTAWDRRLEAGQAALGDTVAAAQSALEGFKVIAGVGARDGVTERFARRSATSRDRAIDVARLWLVFGPALAILGGLPTLVALWIGGVRAIGGHADLGAVVTAVGLAVFLRNPVDAAGHTSLLARVTLASARRLVGLDGVETGVRGRSTTTGAVPTGTELVVAGATFRYPGTERFELPAVTVRASAGHVVLLDGPIGSGKTTVAALIAGDRAPDSGSVTIGAEPVAGLVAEARRRAILRLGPEPFLLAESIAANVRLGAPDAADDEVAEALAVAHAAEFVEVLPRGAATVLADRGASLSGGQRQRLALARAVLARPSVLVLDGAMTGLDADRESAVLESIAGQWSHGVVVVVSSHPTARRLADHVVALPAPAWRSAERAL